VPPRCGHDGCALGGGGADGVLVGAGPLAHVGVEVGGDEGCRPWPAEPWLRSAVVQMAPAWRPVVGGGRVDQCSEVSARALSGRTARALVANRTQHSDHVQILVHTPPI
jgi:hypothetical protein